MGKQKFGRNFDTSPAAQGVVPGRDIDLPPEPLPDEPAVEPPPAEEAPPEVSLPDETGAAFGAPSIILPPHEHTEAAEMYQKPPDPRFYVRKYCTVCQAELLPEQLQHTLNPRR